MACDKERAVASSVPQVHKSTVAQESVGYEVLVASARNLARLVGGKGSTLRRFRVVIYWGEAQADHLRVRAADCSCETNSTCSFCANLRCCRQILARLGTHLLSFDELMQLGTKQPAEPASCQPDDVCSITWTSGAACNPKACLASASQACRQLGRALHCLQPADGGRCSVCGGSDCPLRPSLSRVSLLARCWQAELSWGRPRLYRCQQLDAARLSLSIQQA